MIKDTMVQLFVRDISRLRTEIDAYRSEENLWKTANAIPNSGGNLCLHLVGNLNTYISAELGKSGYVRYRDLEFSRKNVPKQELLQKIDDTLRVVKRTLENLPEEAFEELYPQVVLAEATTTEFLLIHLLAHLSYHLGQINYHRRLLD